jgi:hypothetical protein
LADGLPLDGVPDAALVVDVDRAGVEQEVVNRAEAGHVALVGTAVWAAQSVDAGAFGIGGDGRD